MNRVSCANCKTELSEKPGPDPAGRKPCPNCGSLARTFAVTLVESLAGTDLEIHSAVHRHTVDNVDLAQQVRPGYPPIEQLKHLAHVNERVFQLVYTEPTEPGAPCTFHAFDESGKAIGFGQGSDWEDAYLDIGHQLDPTGEAE